MRLWSLLVITSSVLALSGCETLGLKGSDTAAKSQYGTVAAAKVAGTSTSAQEEKEMAAVMGEDAASDETPGTGEVVDLMPPAPEASAEPADLPPVDSTLPKAAVADGCPGVEVLPDTKSITYFDDKDGRPIGDITARATLVDIRGGCDYTKDSVVVDIDLIMQGHITDKGRYEGRRDLEAFMTFPYFVAVMDADGKLVDKKIMATAMRFKPGVDDLDHAEKITQTIPLGDVSKGSKYTITLGFQLNRQQLDYNRGVVSAKPAAAPKPAAVTPEEKTAEPAAKAEAKPEPVTPKASDSTKEKAEAPAETAKPVEKKAAAEDKPAIPAPTPAQGGSSASRMKPIVD